MIVAPLKNLALLVCVAAAGCSVLSPQPDPSKFYILSPVGQSDKMLRPVSTGANSELTIGVGPVEFPDYLRRLPIVTRVGTNRIEMSDENRWAEPLDRNFMRVLCQNLATLLDTERIEKFPWPIATKIDYQIEVNVQRFEATNDGNSQLVATWMIRDGQLHTILYASKTVASSTTGADQTSASSALSSDLATLSRDIASHCSELYRHHLPGNSAAHSFSRLY